MTEPAPGVLDFDALDGLAFAAERGRLDERAVPEMKAQDIGPVVELAQHAETRLLSPPRAARWLALDSLNGLVQALQDGARRWVCPRTRRMGLFRITPSPLHDETVWTSFGLAAQKAATTTGFPRSIAAQFAAALGELYSNVYEHSENPGSGVIAFGAHPGRFEFVVADRGIGVLQSLRGAAEYAGLIDHGEALRLALTDGVSRYGSNTGRGYGFRPLFVGLANLNGALRFRSGDHALILNGQHPTLMTARPSQKPALMGFLVSVSCELSAQPKQEGT